MSRTHVKSSYGFRSLGIAGFVVAVSFFINAVPALAAGNDGAFPYPSSGGGYGAPAGGAANCYSGSTYAATYNCNRPPSGGSGYTSSGAYNNSNTTSGTVPGTSGATTPSAEIQNRIKKLEEMRMQLQTLLDSLKNGGALPTKQGCSLAVRTTGDVATGTSSTVKHCRPVPHTPRPLRCSEGLPATGFFGAGTSTNTPMCRPSHGTSTPFMSDCTNNDLRRCANVFGGGTSTLWNTLPSYVASPRYGTPSATTSGGLGVFGGYGGSDSSSNGSAVGAPSFVGSGQVRGASSDMSAEMADTLDSLKGDLLDISDMLHQ